MALIHGKTRLNCHLLCLLKPKQSWRNCDTHGLRLSYYGLLSANVSWRRAEDFSEVGGTQHLYGARDSPRHVAASQSPAQSEDLDGCRGLAFCDGRPPLVYGRRFRSRMDRLRQGSRGLDPRHHCARSLPQLARCPAPAPISSCNGVLLSRHCALGVSGAHPDRSAILSVATCANVFGLCSSGEGMLRLAGHVCAPKGYGSGTDTAGRCRALAAICIG